MPEMRRLSPAEAGAALAAWTLEDPARSPWPIPAPWVDAAEQTSPRRSWDAIYGPLNPAPPVVPEPQRHHHRCDERCLCPADGLPMWYAPSSGQHACQDPDCVYARPGD